MATKTDRLGETRMMNCGMEATIIRYGTCADIDIRFEDGTVAVHKTYNAFKKGEIANQNIKASRLSETRMMNCGMEATIIRYGKAIDIDVRFEDGKVVVHKAYDKFKKGSIAHPSTTAKARLGVCSSDGAMNSILFAFGLIAALYAIYTCPAIQNILPNELLAIF